MIRIVENNPNEQRITIVSISTVKVMIKKHKKYNKNITVLYELSLSANKKIKRSFWREGKEEEQTIDLIMLKLKLSGSDHLMSYEILIKDDQMSIALVSGVLRN